jgi:hypothetical protein
MAFIADAFSALLFFLLVVRDSSVEGDGEIAREHDYRRNVFGPLRLSWWLNL